MDKEKTAPEISADQPIRGLSDDLLGRGRFAIAVADAIQRWDEPHSLIVGLYGRWGVGKTSIKNMALSLLRKAESPPIIVDFNPWNWSGEDRLMAAFFEEIAVVLSSDSQDDSGGNVATAWTNYAARLQLGGTSLGHLKTAADVLGLPLVGPILGAAAESANAIADIAEKASNAEAAAEKPLSELKGTLRSQLAESEKSIVVAIDDIDRLTSEEIRRLFRLVRVNADFPKMVYLMMFDRDIVEGALEEVSAGTGRSYLEKIVQAGFDVPRASQSNIERILFEGLDRILTNASAERAFDQDRWQQMYPEALRPFFTSIRDVRRFLSAFSFSVGLFYRERELDINFVDLLSLEVLRVFEPPVYSRLAEAAEWLAPSPLSRLGRGEPHRDEYKPLLESLLDGVDDHRRPVVERLVAAVFPAAEFAAGGHRHEGFRSLWERELRACHDQMFFRYFAQDVSDDEISIARIRRLLNGQTRDFLIAELRSLHADAKLTTTIGRLEAYSESLRPEHVQAMVEAFFEVGDLLPREFHGLFGRSPDVLAFRFLHFNAMQIVDCQTRSKMLMSCLRKTEGFWLPVLFVATEEPRNDEGDPRWDLCVFSEKSMNEARQLALQKIECVDLFQLCPSKACYCLWRWKDWAGPEGPRSWVENATLEPNGAIRVLEMLARQVRSSSGGPTHTYYEFDLNELEQFIEPETLLRRLPDGLHCEEEASDKSAYDEQKRALEIAIHKQRALEQDSKQSD